MIKKVTKYFVFIGLVAGLLVLYSFTKKRNQRKVVDAIAVEFNEGSNPFLTHESVNKLLIQSQVTVKNQPKSILDLHHLENRVASNPYVEKARVFITLGGVLKTHITQKEPIARIISDNEVYYIDKEGAKIPLSSSFSARVPIINGDNLSEKLQEITQLVLFISKDQFLQKEVTGIQILNTNEYVFTVRSGNYRVEFGKYEDVNLKFKKLKAFYNKAIKDKTIKKYKTINLKYHNQVVCTKENQDGEQ
ncbi:cell division protein FtsQ/DivIB [uncultured Tenacibaculum sp.]|uniref:cell division protein FtsQ/DivIB n=1 Tax=uncultured Tenacibaculum sp. TaxID=174713 RepID=UPI002613AE3B|nr:cell division protein FtsQ/DivIB [uncultured Tenacibaculum sp.]